MRKMWGIRILLNALLVTNVTACKILVTVDEDGGGTNPGGCVNVRADSSGSYALNFAAEGKLSVLRTIRPADSELLPTLFVGQFSGQGKVNNFEVCTNNICPMIAIAPAPYQFVRGENDHRLNFGLYSIEEGQQGAVGNIAFNLPNRGIVPANNDGTVSNDLCVERIEFVQDTLALETPIAVPMESGSGSTEPGGAGGASPPAIEEPPVSRPIPYVQFGTFRGEVRIITRNAGVIVLDDGTISPPPPPPPPPPPAACVEVPLQKESGSYSFPFRAEGTLAIAEAVPMIGVIEGPNPIPSRFGFFSGKGYAYAYCWWQAGRICPMMPEILPRYSFSRSVEQDHYVRLGFMDIGYNVSGNVSGFGHISIDVTRVLNASGGSTSPGTAPATLCVSGLEFQNQLSPLVDGSDGKLHGDVTVHTKNFGSIRLSDPLYKIDPPVVTK